MLIIAALKTLGDNKINEMVRQLTDSALYYYDKAIDTAMKLGDDDWIAALAATLVIVALGVVMIVTRHRNKMRLVRLRNEAELNEARRYIDGLEAERKRMAKELHDGVANELLGFSFKLREVAKGDDLQTLVPAIEKIRQGVRSVSHGLM